MMLMVPEWRLKDWVKLNIKHDVGSCKVAYPESLIEIGHNLLEKKWHKRLRGCWWFLTGDLKDGVFFDTINYVGRWLGRNPEILMKLSVGLGIE